MGQLDMICELKRLYRCSIILVTENSNASYHLQLMWSGVDQVLISPYQNKLIATSVMQELIKLDIPGSLLTDQEFKQQLYNIMVEYDEQQLLLKPKCYDLLVYRFLTENSNLSPKELFFKLKQAIYLIHQIYHY